MRILFDYQIFESQRFGGISKVFSELIIELRKYADVEIAIIESDNEHLRNTGLFHDIKPINKLFKLVFSPDHYLGQRTIKQIIKKVHFLNRNINRNKTYCISKIKEGNFDVFVPTYFDDYFLPYLNGKDFSLVIHDFIPERFGFDDYQINQKKKLASIARWIIVPSKQTKDDCHHYLSIDYQKIFVSYWGHHAPLVTICRNITDNNYLLYVGSRTEYKNFIPFLHEFAKLKKIDPSLTLLCTGSKFSTSETQIIQQLQLMDSVINVFVQDSDMPSLFHNAKAFVYPSSYEGFGLPILDAFAAQCPVFLFDNLCFREIAGNAACYFDFDGNQSFSDVYLHFCEQYNENRRTLTQKGTERLRMYSWGKTAETWFSLLDNQIESTSYGETINNNHQLQ